MEQGEVCRGSRFGYLTCIAREGENSWRCQCKCGNETVVDEQMLISGVITSCGCRKARCLNLQGERFGRLVVEKPMQKRDLDSSVRWLCRCDCGNHTIVSSNKLRMGHTKSCGCIGIEAAIKKKTYIDGTCMENILSRKLPRNNTSGYRGVAPKRNRWQAYITYAGKKIQLGTHGTVQEAVAAREHAEQQLIDYLNHILAEEEKNAEKQ